MMRVSFVFVSLCVALLQPTAATAGPVPAGDRASPYMRIYGPAHAPYGFVRFCETNPEHCAPGRLEEARVAVNPERLSDLDEVNRTVNRAVKPVTDMELYGVSEHWTMPNLRGDCEDYALLKRHLLLKRGWPTSALLLTVVRDEKGEGHAVLTARTAQGDFILDNKVEDVRLWSRTAYDFVMRQSYLDPRVWVTLDPMHAPSPALFAGVRAAR